MPFDPSRLDAARNALNSKPETPKESGRFEPEKLAAVKAAIRTPYAGGLAGDENYAGLSIANVKEELGQATGPILGGFVGGFAGPGGVPLGAAAGRAAQSGLQAGMVGADIGAVKAVGEPALEAASQVIGGKVLGKAGEFAGAAYNKAVPLMAGLNRAANGVPQPVGEAVFRDPSILYRAMKGGLGEAYDAFERYTGLEGLGRYMARTAQRMDPGKVYTQVVQTMNKLANKSGPQPTEQELYLASQMAAEYKRFFPAGTAPSSKSQEFGIMSQAKSAIDDALETSFPEYKILRRQYFEGKAAEAFGQALPQNVNQSPNVLRTTAAMANAADAAQEGDVGRGLLSLAVSPIVVGTGLQAGYAATKAAGMAIPSVASTATQASLNALKKKYNQRRLGAP